MTNFERIKQMSIKKLPLFFMNVNCSYYNISFKESNYELKRNYSTKRHTKVMLSNAEFGYIQLEKEINNNDN